MCGARRSRIRGRACGPAWQAWRPTPLAALKLEIRMSLTHTQITDELAGYLRDVTLREPGPLQALREETENHEHASMQTAPEQGQLLNLMIRLLGAKRI